MVKLFVDSSAWISLFDRSEKHHLLATSQFSQLVGSPLTLITSDYVFDEAITFLQRRTNHHIAAKCGNWILNTSYVEMLRVNEAVWQAAWEMFQQYSDKGWAFTDCTSFVLMQQHALYHTFAFDHHFTQAGFILWPKAEISH